MNQIIVLMGSPRRKGNTAKLVEAFLSGIKTENCTVEVIDVATKEIHGCIGCNHCYRDEQHRCVFKDDMITIYERLAQANTIVIATPVYFYSISSQLKAIVDRLHNPIRNTFRVKQLALLSVCADTIPSVFDSILVMYRSVLDYFNLKDAGIVTVNGVSNPGDIVGNSALDKARKLGEKLSSP